MALKHEIVIQNVVVSADTHMKFPLELLAQKLEGAEYEPESFPGLVYRVDKPKSSTLLFTTGKVICSGSKSLGDARKAIKRTLEKIGEAGIKAILHHPDLANVNFILETPHDDLIQADIAFLKKHRV